MKNCLAALVAILFVSVIPAHAAPVLYTGELVVKKVSGKECTGKETGTTKSASLVLDRQAGVLTGYLWGDFATGRFNGTEGTTLDLRYPFADMALAEGHSVTLMQQGKNLHAVVRERHLENTVDHCNWDEADLKLTPSSDNAAMAWKKAEAKYNAQVAREQGNVLYKQGKYVEAIPLYEKALFLREEAEGKTAEVVSWYLNSLVRGYGNAGRLDDARRLLDEGLKRFPTVDANKTFRETSDWLKILPETKLADNYFYQAKELENDRRYSEAVTLYLKALEIDRRIRPKDAVVGLGWLAICFKKLQKFAEAEAYNKEAISLSEKQLGQEHYSTATSLNNLASLYEITGRYSEAEPLLKRSLAIHEKQLGPDHPSTATSLNNLALLYNNTGRYSEAEPLLKRSLAIDENKLGQEHYSTATSLNNLALLYETTGRYAEAESLYKRSLAIHEKQLGPDHPSTATSLNNLAGLYRTTGRYAEAEPLYKRSLAIYEKQLGPEHRDTALGLNNLALLYETTGRYSEVESLYKRSLAIKEKRLGPDHPSTATSLNNLAALYKNTGCYIEAEPLLKRSLAIYEKQLGPEHRDTAMGLNNLAALYSATGRYSEAVSLIQRALRIAANANNPEILYNVQDAYSGFLEKQNNSEAAIFFAKQSVNTLQGLRQNVSALGKETLKTYTASVEGAYKHLTNLLIEQGRLAEAQQVMAMLKEEEYFQFIRRDAGNSGKLTTRASFTSAEEPWYREYETISAENARLGKEIGTLREKAKRGTLSDQEKSQLAQLTQQETQATTAFNNFMARLIKAMKQEAKTDADRLEEIGSKGLKTVTALKSTLKTLGEGSVVLHYLIMDDRIHILLTTPDTQLARHSTIKATELNKKIFVFRDALKDPRIDPRPLGKELYNILIAPVASDLKASHAQTLMLSLDGALRYLPFSALHDGSGYLVQNYRTVMYAEAAKDKIALPPQAHWKVAALGVGAKVHADFSALPSVPGELSAIVRSDAGGVIPGEIRLDKNFTQASLSETALNNPVVHIASHFKFVPGNENDSFLLLGDGTTLSLDKVRNGTFFQDTELLTLSACETAMGTNGKGTEIEGFGALAMNQGAKAVIATLWPVADESTSLIMQQFYKLHEEKHLSKVEALRQAQLALLTGSIKEQQATDVDRGSKDETRPRKFRADPDKPFAHPYFWAPFIMMGNWR